MHRRLLLSLLLSSLALSACSSLPAGVSVPGQHQQAVSPVLGSALLKRPLMLRNIDGKIVPVAGVLTPQAGFSVQQVSSGGSAGSAPMIAIAPAPDIAMSARPAIGPMYYYGGGEFNQYQIQYAEESIHKAATGNSLLTVHNQDVKPLLASWDASARLIESRAQVNGTEEEYIHLPGKSGEPVRLRPLYVFRFASSPKKETMNIYVLSNEIRVHRMVWGEPNIEIGRVQVDSDKALEIARKAFAARDAKPGYPVYPEATDVNAQVIYDIPSDLRWNLTLNQQSKDQIRYFINFSFERKVEGQPVPIPMPMPMTEPAMDTSVSNTTTIAKPMPATSPAYYPQYFYGSAEVDAISGEVKSLNRPVYYGGVAYGRGEAVASAGVATPAVAPAPVAK